MGVRDRRPWFNPVTSLRIPPVQVEGRARHVVWVTAQTGDQPYHQSLSAGRFWLCRAGKRLPSPRVATAVTRHPATSGEIHSAGTPVAISEVPRAAR